jgi:UDP-N-acetylmuramoyl-L-alanyl-D-glutamate--2,6-diaminopimelate ligase/murE/murF fusion protein
LKLSYLVEAINIDGNYQQIKSVSFPNVHIHSDAIKIKSGENLYSGIFQQHPENTDYCLDPDIGSIHYKAQDVKPSGLFVAIPGHRADGHDFIDMAIDKGASAIVVQKEVAKYSIIIEVENTRKALGRIAAKFYGNPSEKLVVIGITGTNGKTTTAYLVESILKAAGFKTGVIGTINCRYSGKTFPSPVTTPESLDLQQILSEMLTDGITHVVMEVSSHAIDLSRIESCFFDAAVFTNLTQDHLDYHKDMESYWEVKKKLFTESLPTGPKKKTAFAVINCNNEKGKELSGNLSVKCIKTGYDPGCSVFASDSNINVTGIKTSISTHKSSFEIKSGLVGKHNIENIMSAVGVALGLGISSEIIKKGIESLSVIPGRLERINNKSGISVYVDYAHTPDALKNVLLSLKPITKRNLICIFGCGGDRDKTKRPLMGELVANLSDFAIVTSDNPRTEDPIKIIEQILTGIKKNKIEKYEPTGGELSIDKRGYLVEPDRKKAIHLGIKIAGIGDVVLIAGKGHETYQLIGKDSFPFDDRQEARLALLQLETKR